MRQPRIFQRLGRISFAFLAALSVVASGLGSLTGCAKESDEPPGVTPPGATAGPQVVRLKPEAAAAAGVEVRPVARGAFRTHRDFPATVQPNKNKLAEVTTLVRGRATDVYVDVGADVQGGALLAKLYSSDLGLAQSTYLKTAAKLHESELAYERAKSLLEDKAISLAELQKREAEVKSARAEAREARDRLQVLGLHEPDIQRLDREHQIQSSVSISAPFAGRVIARNLAKGEVVETHHELFTVADLSEVWVVANIPEKDVRFIRRDQSVEIRLAAYPQEIFQGTITYVGDVLDPATRTMQLRVTAPNREGRLKPEMFATVRVYTNTVPDALTVPMASVQRDQGQAFVFVQTEPGSFEARAVQLGDESGDVVKVSSGLREGELLVVKGAFALKSEADQHKLEQVR